MNASNRNRDPAPLKQREFLMLLVLAQQPSHGYALKQEILERTGGQLDLGPGTLYRTVHGLEAAGLIAEVDEPGDAADPRRRTYEITDLGREVAASEATRLDALVREARAGRLIP
jgi:DNA-binding PadR family transcriptional regulator